MFTTYGLIAALAMAAMLLAAGLHCRRKIPYGSIMTLCVCVIPGALLGSRLLFSVYAFSIGDFTSLLHPLRFLDGGASLTGAIGGAIAGAALAAKITGEKPGVLLDGIALGAPLAILILRVAEPLTFADNWIYELGFGRNVDTEALAFLGEAFDGRHPVFLYQAVTAAILGVVVLLLHRRSRCPGDTLLVFLTLYGGTQMVFSSLNSGGNEHMVWYYIRFDQIAGLIMLLTAFVIFAVRWGRAGAKGWQLAVASALILLGGIVGVRQEFAVDSNDYPLIEYAIMAAAVALMAAVTLIVRRKSIAE